MNNYSLPVVRSDKLHYEWRVNKMFFLFQSQRMGTLEELVKNISSQGFIKLVQANLATQKN